MNCVTTAHVSVPWWPRSNAHPCTGYKHLPYQRIARVLRTLTRTESTRYEFVAQPELSLSGKSLHSGRLFHIYPKIGNLPSVVVSNAGRARATSHPCERGAGLLQNQAGSGVANSRRAGSHHFVEVCDVARSKIRPRA